MKKIKILLSFLLIVVGLQQLHSQVYNFKTTAITLSEKLPNDNWSKWSEPAQTNLIIKLDTKKSRITVYSQIIQLFEIIEYLDEKETKTDKTVSFVCKDNMGEDCNIAIITRKSQDDRMQFYITYDDRIINYNIEVFN